jgi:2,4-dienoyl-CoA reductase-like NADH-dependent reductase (Old Yellow Enzyme family)
MSNIRDDSFGGQSLDNRLRYPLRLIKACREAWLTKPLFVRISASDRAEWPEKDEAGIWRQWGIEQSTILVGKLQEIGVDLVDCSSGGNWIKQNIAVKHGYQVYTIQRNALLLLLNWQHSKPQVHFAEALKRAYPSLPIGTVGVITDPHETESYLKAGKADVVFLARELMRAPHWPLIAAKELGIKVKAANQYERAWH